MAQRIIQSAGAARRKARKAATLVEARKRKEFTFRGLTLPELQALPFDDQLGYLPARARRTLVRGLTQEQQDLVQKIRNAEPGTPVKTHRREMVILPEMVGHVIALHNGKSFENFQIQPEMIGHYFGEFALTRAFKAHGGVGVGATRGSKHLPLK
jgi:small subunit ribosomal protein S19